MEHNNLCRAGEISRLTGLSPNVVARLAAKGRIPSFRPDPEGNRFYNAGAVLAALGLDETTITANYKEGHPNVV